MLGLMRVAFLVMRKNEDDDFSKSWMRGIYRELRRLLV